MATEDAEIIKDLSVENPESKVLPLKPGVVQNIAVHVSPAARDFFAKFYLPSPFFFFFNLSPLFPVLAVAKVGFCVSLQTKMGHPAHRHR